MQLRLECRNISYSEAIFFWSAEPDAREHIADFGYTLEISESAEGPWFSIFTDPIYAFGYVDTTTQRGMVDQRIYYRVKAINPNKIIFYSDPICLFEEETNFITNYIAENESLLLRRFNGQECLHFARKKFGDRCEICWDQINHKSIKPKCIQCFGTTFKNGYFAPVKIGINTDPKPKQTDKDQYGTVESKGLSGWTSNRVIVESDDLIVFLKKPSERYKVDRVIPTSMNGATVRQMLSFTQLTADNPAQLLNVDATAYTLDEFNIFRRDWKSLA